MKKQPVIKSAQKPYKIQCIGERSYCITRDKCLQSKNTSKLWLVVDKNKGIVTQTKVIDIYKRAGHQRKEYQIVQNVPYSNEIKAISIRPCFLEVLVINDSHVIGLTSGPNVFDITYLKRVNPR